MTKIRLFFIPPDSSTVVTTINHNTKQKSQFHINEINAIILYDSFSSLIMRNSVSSQSALLEPIFKKIFYSRQCQSCQIVVNLIILLFQICMVYYSYYYSRIVNHLQIQVFQNVIFVGVFDCH